LQARSKEESASVDYSGELVSGEVDELYIRALEQKIEFLNAF